MAIARKSLDVTHHLKVTRMVCLECEEIIVEGLAALDGVISVVANWQKNIVRVTYDIHKVQMGSVEKLLTEIGFPPDLGFFQRKKRDWMRFTDQNRMDSLNHQGACCSKAPK